MSILNNVCTAIINLQGAFFGNAVEETSRFIQIDNNIADVKFFISSDREISFYINDGLLADKTMSESDRRKLIYILIKAWKEDVLPSLQKGKTYFCSPISTSRAKLYKRFGFVEVEYGDYALKIK